MCVIVHLLDHIDSGDVAHIGSSELIKQLLAIIVFNHVCESQLANHVVGECTEGRWWRPLVCQQNHQVDIFFSDELLPVLDGFQLSSKVWDFVKNPSL